MPWSWLGLATTLAVGCAEAAAPPGILLVSLDTTRWDTTTLGGPRNTTPNLARLAARGTTYTRAYAVANESVTSHAALFTGRYPSELAIAEYGTFALPAGTPTLAAALAAHGWSTAAFTGGGHVVSEFGLHQGFDTFRTVGGPHSFGSLYDSVPEATAWIADQEGPWFAFVHGYDAHTPYVQRGPFAHPWGDDGATARIESIVADDLALEQLRGHLWFRDRTPTDFTHAVGRTVLGTDFYRLPAEPRPGESVALLSERELDHLRDHYAAGVHYADVWLGVLLASVDLDNTLVIVVSDHGEDLLDHGFVNHRAGLWDSTLHVPLVVAGPGVEVGVRTDLPTELRSVVPTVLAHADIPVLAGATAAPLGQGSPDAPLFAEGTMDALSVFTPSLGRLTLHEAGLATGARTVPTDVHDPRLEATGTDGVAPGHTATVAPLLAHLQAWRARLVPATTTATPVPAALREALQARGYWVPAPDP